MRVVGAARGAFQVETYLLVVDGAARQAGWWGRDSRRLVNPSSAEIVGLVGPGDLGAARHALQDKGGLSDTASLLLV